MTKRLFLAATITILTTSPALANEKHQGLHFKHPLISESPSPDTKIRLDYNYQNKPGEDGEAGSHNSTIALEGEYAFNRSLSIEASVPYTYRNAKGTDPDTDDFGNAELALKYANYNFEEKGILLGGGIEFGLPTGNSSEGIGSSHVLEIEPFLDFGYEYGPIQLIAFLKFGFPTNENTDDETDLELSGNLALLYEASPGLDLILELDSEKVYGGEEDGHDIVNVTPGFKYQWPGNPALSFSAGISFPITDDKEFYAMPLTSAFYHF